MHYTPLRYPGGKTKLAPLIKNIFKDNNLIGGTYIEPYSGGAGVAISLLLENYAQSIIINDLDPVIYAFWKTLLENTDWLCTQIEQIPVTVKEWETQRYINKNFSQYPLHQVGFSTFFLNRTNRSGIIQGGIIGGKKQNSQYKIDCRYNKINLVKRIQEIAKHKDKIQVFNADAVELIDLIEIKTPQKALFYFDPPYFNKGQTLYKNSYTPDCHKHVASKIKKLNFPWIVTYDNADTISKLYHEYPCINLNINYSAYKMIKGSELLFYNNIHQPRLSA